MTRRFVVTLCCALTSSALLLVHPGQVDAAQRTCPFGSFVQNCVSFCGTDIDQQCSNQYGHFGCIVLTGFSTCVPQDYEYCPNNEPCCDPYTGDKCGGDIQYPYCTNANLTCYFS